MVGDEIYEGFGVCLAFKRVALFDEELFYVFVVFDNAVVDYREIAVARNVRVRVCVGHRAVGCPARVADSHGRVERVLFDLLCKNGNASLFLHDVERSLVVEKRKPRGVIPAVFELQKPLYKNRRRVPTPNVSRDSAHK